MGQHLSVMKISRVLEFKNSLNVWIQKFRLSEKLKEKIKSQSRQALDLYDSAYWTKYKSRACLLTLKISKNHFFFLSQPNSKCYLDFKVIMEKVYVNLLINI